MLTRASMQWYWDHYLKDAADANKSLRLPVAEDVGRLTAALAIHGRV